VENPESLLNPCRPPAATEEGSSATQRSEARRARPACVSSTDLLGGKDEVIIVHDGREYRLRVTQRGKLILTA
jgi:hemin uptake protein HemP